MRRDGTGPAAAARHRRQHRHAGLHRPQDRLGPQARAGDLRQDRQGPAAQGLYPAADDRRLCRGNERRLRHALARRRQARLVRRTAGADRPQPRPHAAPRRGLGPLGRPQARAGPPLGHDRQGGDRRRGRGQRRRGRRHRRHPPGRGLRLAGHLGRAVHLQRPLPAQHRRRRARLLPRHPRHLAPDGRDPQCHRQPQLAVGRHRQEAGRALRCRRAKLQGTGRGNLPTLSQRRAHPAQQCRRPRLLRRPQPSQRPGASRPGRDGGRRFRLP